MVRSAATPRVSNHEAMGYAVMIPQQWNPLQIPQFLAAFFQTSVGRGNVILNCALQPLASGPGSG